MTTPGSRFLRLLCIALLFAFPILASEEEEPTRRELRPVLRGAAFLWEPYQYLGRTGGLETIEGFDVELTRELIEPLGYSVSFEQMGDLSAHLRAIRKGEIDFTTGPPVPEFERDVIFSHPIRRETNVLFIRRGEESSFRFRNVDELLGLLQQRKLRIGVMRGFNYSPDSLHRYIADGKRSGVIEEAPTTADLIHALTRTMTIDAFIIDRLAAETVAQRMGDLRLIRALSLPREVSVDICLMFNRKTVSPEFVAEVNANLAKMKRQFSYGQLVRSYALPILLSMTVHQPWFLAMDLIGVIAFAMAGTLIARKEHYSLFGALFIAALPTVGGGLVRDIIVNRRPVGILRSPLYVTTIIAVVLIGFAISKLLHFVRQRRGSDAPRPDEVLGHLDYPLEVCDALGLAACTVVGVIVAIENRAAPLMLWGPVLAALSGSGGGILRDVVRAHAGHPILKTSFYGEIAFLWGLALSLFLHWETSRLNPDEVSVGVVVAFIGTFVTRMAVVHLRIKAPSFRDEELVPRRTVERPIPIPPAAAVSGD